MKTPAARYLSVLLALFALGCAGDGLPTAVSNDLEPTVPADNGLAKVTPGEPIALTGLVHGRTTFVRTGEPVMPDVAFGMNATLTFKDKQNILLSTDWMPPVERHIDHEGKMTPSGSVIIEQPAADIPSIIEHTGCALSGRSTTFHGTYDGDHFYVCLEFQGVCDGGTMWGPAWGVSRESGPLHWSMCYDLNRNGS